MNLKVIIWLVVILAAIPLVVKFWPRPMTFDRIEKGFKSAGFTVENVHDESPSLEAVAVRSMTVNGASVVLYQYDNEGSIATQLADQQPDAGEAIVEASGLRAALGAAPLPPMRTDAARRGMFMITVSSVNRDARERIIDRFKSF